MPVKVRCPTCEKVLNAPETARGKAVKCPGCETKVKVPAANGDSGERAAATTRRRDTKTPARKSADSDSSDFLAKLDLDTVADSGHAICPKCGASIPDEATECPKCGVDPETGRLSARAKKRLSRKGPDPALYYKHVWTDSWAFLKENFSVAIRTAVYLFVAMLVYFGCLFMVVWCETWPPRVFWLGLAFADLLAVVGWPWHLVIETVRTTVARKSSIRGINFDAFLCIAFGIKFVAWSIAFCWLPFAFLMYPLAMIHMAMPVTRRAWLNFAMAATFFKNVGPTLYYWVISLATTLAVLTLQGLGYFCLALIFSAAYAEAIATRKPPNNLMGWLLDGIALTFTAAVCIGYGAIEVFKARAIGLMAYYFKDTLDLVVIVAEPEYKRKEVLVDKWGNPIRSTGEKVMLAVVAFVVVLVVAGAGYWIYVTQFKKS
jgi:ribosomal protein L40E